MRRVTLWLLILLCGRSESVEFTEFVPPSEGTEQGTLFTELDAGAIGVGEFENNYSGPEVWTERWREYILGTIGTGIALGDVDGDLKPDLFVVSKDEKSRLYKNLGGMRFEDVTDVSGIIDNPAPGSGCSFADVDNDGDLDLYLCFVGAGNELWINDGTGRFTEEAEERGVAVKSGCGMASFADYDRDGDLDFYLLNNLIHQGANFSKLEDMVFRNDGGHFVEVSKDIGISGAGHGHSALWWDYNEDGWPDIYVANDFSDLDRLYENNKDGTFTDILSEVMPQVPYYSMGADFGDVNNDGHSDYWVADMAATSREQHLRTVGNHDHVFDLHKVGDTPQYLKNCLLLKLSETHFAEIAYLSGLARTDWTWASRLLDLNNDGRLDAFATNGMLRSFHDGDLGKKQKRFSSDKWMAIVFRNQPTLKERNLVFENLGDLTFEDRSAAWGLDKLGVSFGVACGDLDGDGDLDLAINNFQDKLSIFRNDEDEGSRVTFRLKGKQSNSFGIGARIRLESDGLVQVKEMYPMRGYMSSDEPILHFGLGNSSRIDRVEVSWPSGAVEVFEDLPVNGNFLLEEGGNARDEPWSKSRSRMFTAIDGKLPEKAERTEARFLDLLDQPLLSFRESRLGGAIVHGDVDRDGDVDLVLGGSTGQETLLLLNDGSGTFQDVSSIDFETDFGSEDLELNLVDWDGDGDLDLLAASGGVEMEAGDSFYANRLYLNDGNGYLERDWSLAFSESYSSSSVVEAADFDADGETDLFVGTRLVPGKYPYSESSELWSHTDGALSAVSLDDDALELGKVADACWGDLDADGDLDLAVATEWGCISIIENEGGELRRSSKDRGDLDSLNGLWSQLAVADLDGNGTLDIVAGNWGLNTEMTASSSEPMRLWYGERSSEPVNLIETVVSEGKEWTLEAKWRFEKSFPGDISRSLSYEAFAQQSLQEMFPNLEEKGYRFKEVRELRSGIFWMEKDGRYRFEALPAFAQSGRAMDLLLEDIDGDGRLDVLMSLELQSPEPWANRFEKGHLGLFLNKGERAFESVLPWDSGLSFQGSPRGLASCDIDGDGSKELVVVLSEGMPVVFARASEALDK
ncbi:VCBS repeat-containing protein [Pelagicoccus mobilis]|uniref:VCBS repeat-containing protein n=1 Tax=Pelagicoccus mobilis TaxID=415221 RepID=A0A934VRT1_9BACT|nr:VCBS repeat-containing protein [Pelagicoccus mobilis]MBK1879727.1 VCBS repeat-containing protein [Pelagicoccus mobilis]